MRTIENQGKVSIIVPVYNTEEYLPKCLDSIVGQTYSDLEIICVDDGSTDNSHNILDEYAAKDKRIMVIHERNSGSSKARNRGLDLATGEWITFVDSDDWINPHMYERLLNDPHMDDSDIRACGYYFSNPDNKILANNLFPVPEGVQEMRSFLFYIYCRDDYKGVGSYIWNKIIKKSVIDNNQNPIRFDETLGSLGEDLDWLARCYMKSKTIAYISEPLYYYTERCDSIFHDMEQRLEKLQHIRAYEKIIELYKENKVDERTINYVIRFYVYHLGVLLDYAQRTGRIAKAEVLREKAIRYLPIYTKMNQDYPDRIKWIENLLGGG